MRTPSTNASFSDRVLHKVEELSQVPYPRPVAWYWALGSLLEPQFKQLGYGGQKAETLAAMFPGLTIWSIRKAVRLRRHYGDHRCGFVLSIGICKALWLVRPAKPMLCFIHPETYKLFWRLGKVPLVKLLHFCWIYISFSWPVLIGS